MAKLTLTFKDRILQVIPLVAEKTVIGRDPESDIVIDSLAIAPHHALVRRDATGAHWIHELDARYPVLVNDIRTTERQLTHGDSITLGKHILLFTDERHRPTTTPAATTTTPPRKPPPAKQRYLEAGLQVLNGKHIGRMVPLRNAMTRLGKDTTATAVIARRKDGYYLSALTGGDQILVNHDPIEDRSVRLQNGDTIKIEQNLMQFFCSHADSTT